MKFKKPNLQKKSKDVQLFVNKNYRTIQFVLVVLLALLALFIIFNQVKKAADDSRGRQETLLQREKDARVREKAIADLLAADQAIVRDIKANQERQTELIICLLAAHSSNIEITPNEEETCRLLVFEATEENTARQGDFLDQ